MSVFLSFFKNTKPISIIMVIVRIIRFIFMVISGHQPTAFTGTLVIRLQGLPIFQTYRVPPTPIHSQGHIQMNCLLDIMITGRIHHGKRLQFLRVLRLILAPTEQYVQEIPQPLSARRFSSGFLNNIFVHVF